MTTHISNPFRHEDGAEVYDLSAELFFCLLQLYQDFSKKQAGFELTKYYEIYLQVFQNKRVLSALFTPKSNLSAYLESYRFDYDITNQKQIDNFQPSFQALPEPLHFYRFKDNFSDLIVPATMLKNLYLSYKTFLYKNKTGYSLTWQGYTLAFLGDEPLMAMAIYPGNYQNDWMNGELGGLHGYVIYDLKQDTIVKSYVHIWGMLKTRNEEGAAARKRQNKRINKQLRKQSRQ